MDACICIVVLVTEVEYKIKFLIVFLMLIRWTEESHSCNPCCCFSTGKLG